MAILSQASVARPGIPRMRPGGLRQTHFEDAVLQETIEQGARERNRLARDADRGHDKAIL
jgi:hypothetical protein